MLDDALEAAHAPAFADLHALRAEGRLAQFDIAFARTLCRHGLPAAPELAAPFAFAAALVSARSARQDVYVDLATLAEDDPLELATGDATTARYPDLPPLLAALHASAAVQLLADAHDDAPVLRPLVLVGARLYLARQFEHERALGQALRVRAAAPWHLHEDAAAQATAEAATAGFAQLRAALATLFEAAADEPVNWQRVAAGMMLGRGLTVITGGPGTGKTTTVTRALVLLAHLHPHARIALAAPTGKAAARLGEAVQQAKQRLRERMAAGDASIDERALVRVPEQGTTLHRLLGYRPLENSFRHHAREPLPVDVLVIDEASMLDLRLARAALAALAPDARLVIVGDKDQLSSVDAGRVLGDICAGLDEHFEQRRFSPATAAALEALTGQPIMPLAAPDVPAMADCVAWLRRSHRFVQGGGIARLAEAINRGDAAAMRQAAASDDVQVQDPDTTALVQHAVLRYRPMLAAARAGDAKGALAALGGFRVLCAVREGRDGVLALNRAIGEALAGDPQPAQQHIASSAARPSSSAAPQLSSSAAPRAGLPVIVLRNDPRNGLANGDVGVLVRDGDTTAVAFPGADGGVRLLPLARLPAWEPVYAMTIHKSQGSEFADVAVVLPRAPSANESRLLTRELLYTAVTRARERVQVLATSAVLQAALATRTRRASSLRALLWR
jgi:exodeoxyribonuclease V alpha subunit